MIRFHLGPVKLENSKVYLGNDREAHPAQAIRDSAGNIDVTVDTMEPAKDEAVTLILTGENDATFEGIVKKKDGELLFQSVTGGG